MTPFVGRFKGVRCTFEKLQDGTLLVRRAGSNVVIARLARDGSELPL